MLMLRATLYAVVGLLNHNQPNLVHACVSVLEVVAGGSTEDINRGGSQPRNSKRCQVLVAQRREG